MSNRLYMGLETHCIYPIGVLTSLHRKGGGDLGILEVRKARGLSRKAFSDQIGYAEVTVGRWERGERKIPGSVAVLVEILLRDI